MSSDHYSGPGPPGTSQSSSNTTAQTPPTGAESHQNQVTPEGSTGVDLSAMGGVSGGGGGNGTLVATSMSALPVAAGYTTGGVGVTGPAASGQFISPAAVAGQPPEYSHREPAFYGQQTEVEAVGDTSIHNETGLVASEEVLQGEAPQGRENAGPIKLFVGQVPKTMTEEDLFPTFAEFGAIKELMIIRDKHTGQHRGCAFVTYWSVEDADRVQESLHDQLTLPGGRKPLQIRPAIESSGQNPPISSVEQENKLFVGMTSRNADESSIRDLFAPFGEIREIYIIRHADGSNKGCAFLKFVQRESALSAIEALNDKVVMEGATRPLIVKFADTKADRKAKQVRGAGRGRGPLGGDSPGGPGPYYITHPGPPVPVFAGGFQPGQQGPPMAIPPQFQTYPGPYVTGVSPGGTPPPPPPNYPVYPVPRHPYGYPPAGPFPHPPGSSPAGGPGSTEGTEQGSGASSGGGPLPPFTRSPARAHDGSYGGGSGGVNVNPRPREGPTGANLFIYHLPHDLTDADLATAFNPFGNVISAKVYVDKYTGESKGFGFVSYDSVSAAEQAIEQMNGFQIGSKRLKVQHKRVTNHNAGRRQEQQYSEGAMMQPPTNPEGAVGGLHMMHQTHHQHHGHSPDIMGMMQHQHMTHQQHLHHPHHQHHQQPQQPPSQQPPQDQPQQAAQHPPPTQPQVAGGGSGGGSDSNSELGPTGGNEVASPNSDE